MTIVHITSFSQPICHSTESALIRVQNDILTEIDNNCVMLFFLDLSAGFDTVNHQVLSSRLSDRFEIKGSALSWFESYPQGRNAVWALTTQDLPVET